MNSKELLKKYWFVCVIGIILIAFIGVYAVDAYKNRELTVSSKDVDGKSAVYSVDGEYVFADDFFDSLYLQNGANCSLTKFINAVINDAYDTTDEMKNNATSNAAAYYQYYGEDYCKQLLTSKGYTNGISDLPQFFIDSQKELALYKDYIKDNYDELFANYDSQTEKPRMVYHILINVADVVKSTDADGETIYTPNPTEEEQAKIDAVVQALKDGKDFLEVQSEYNEDTSNNPYFVNVSNSSSLVAPFLNASIELNDGETSDLVATNYGYHIIKNYGTDKNLLIENTTFIDQLYSANPNSLVKAIMEKADSLGYKLVDEELSTYISTQLDESEDAE